MNRRKWGLPTCPYCGKKLGFWEAWLLRTKGEYTCSGCRKSSNVKFDRITYSMAVIASVLGLGILFVYSLLKQGDSLWGTLLVALPFLCFALFAPCWMYLERFPSTAAPGGIPRQETYRGPSAHTTVMPAVGRRPAAPPVPHDTVVMPPVRGNVPPGRAPAGSPVYRDSTGRPVRRANAPSEGLRPTPPAAGARPDRAFVPPPKRGAPPRQGGARPQPPKQ